MRFATYKGERSLSDLVGRLFEIKGPRTEALAKEAEAALLRANPHLRDLKKLPEGTVILVPEVPDVKPTDEARHIAASAGELLEEVRQGLKKARATLAASATRHGEQARRTLRLLKSRQVTTLAAKTPAVRARLPQIAEAANARLKEAEALKKFQEQALPQLDKDLADLAKRLVS